MQQKKRAWLYCRIDAPEDTHGALKGQQKELLDYAEQMGFEFAGVSEDIGSEANANHSGLMEVIRAGEAGEIDVLLVKRVDRLGRDTVKTQELLRDLGHFGIQIYSPLEGEITHGRQRGMKYA